MASYSQRFLSYHRFVSDIFEDIFAVTLCLPFTMALHSLNTTADILTEIPTLPEDSDRVFWKVGKSLFLVPLYALKGFVSIFIVPFIALGLAFQKTEPKKYPFYLGHFFQVLALNRIVRLITLLNMPTISLNFWITIALIWGMLSGGLNAMLASTFISGEIAIECLLITVPFIEGLLLLTSSLSLPLIATFAIVIATSYTEGLSQKLGQYFAKKLDALITFVQSKLLKRGYNPFNNKTEVDFVTPVHEIPENNLFVSNSNHAFDLAILQESSKVRGLENYYYKEHTRLDKEDFLRLEKHPHLNKFPQLAEFLKEHKQDYVKTGNSKISEPSLAKLEELAQALVLPESTPNFLDNLITKKEAFDTHLTTIPVEEKQAVENLNLLGGADPEYKLVNVLPKVLSGGWCKKGAGRLTHETVHRERNPDSSAEASVFWQREFPTHWMRF